jgi:hypothetical protein
MLIENIELTSSHGEPGNLNELFILAWHLFFLKEETDNGAVIR